MLWCNRVWVWTVLQLMYKTSMFGKKLFYLNLSAPRLQCVFCLFDSLRMYMCCVSFYWSTAALETGSHGYRFESLYCDKAPLFSHHDNFHSLHPCHASGVPPLQSGGGAMQLSGAFWLTSGSSSIWRSVFARGLWELLYCWWYCNIQVSMGKGQQTDSSASPLGQKHPL